MLPLKRTNSASSLQKVAVGKKKGNLSARSTKSQVRICVYIFFSYQNISNSCMPCAVTMSIGKRSGPGL